MFSLQLHCDTLLEMENCKKENSNLWAGAGVQKVECLLSKYQTLSSNPTTRQKKKKKKKFLI